VSVNDQWRSLTFKEFCRKRCHSCLKAKGANSYIRKIEKSGEFIEEPLSKRVSLIEKGNERAKVSHGELSWKNVR
jgi:hypothetical protein